MEKIKELFDGHFGKWGVSLPDDYMARGDAVAQIREQGWSIWYKCGVEANRRYLDYYASHRMTNDRHVRIWEDGEGEHLPALCSEYV